MYCLHLCPCHQMLCILGEGGAVSEVPASAGLLHSHPQTLYQEAQLNIHLSPARRESHEGREPCLFSSGFMQQAMKKACVDLTCVSIFLFLVSLKNFSPLHAVQG